ncbi:DNA cytosine methyltransferase [Akkermansia muciniphila]|uniref:DNA cytosine methyltransferase n=1 Tax=Akkermansia muciniphila TaxID=239935 RepID=UPI00080CA6A4|nr:DNA cytosine methyltransferase [Akkermansia muciniphila]ANU61995.1 DNA cytosine methyltransferase [Akkermansia muciniphila]ASB35488.1 DNA cytosine methyltransferase [Akkermansia muciniphila]WAK79048.1 DNA-cytosine methyltransferase [Akkermansia phage Chantilly]
MKYLSVCSGIEAASVAWESLGWEPVAFSEIEPFPSAVLAERFPDVPNLGDMTRYEQWNIPAINLLVGGTPCQAFSVAGKRGSLADDRGNLCLTFCRMADHFSPRWVLWENVPGVLSTPDNAFGCFLAALCGADATVIPPGGGRKHPNSGVVAGPKRTVAWRVLDAQWHRVPQRRKRVFVLAVAGAGNWASADALLPVGERVPGNLEACRKAWKEAAGNAGSRFEGSHWDGGRVHPTLFAHKSGVGMSDQEIFRQRGAYLVPDVAPTLVASYGDKWTGDQYGFFVYENHAQDSRVREMENVCSTVSAKYGTGGGNTPIVVHLQQDPVTGDDVSPCLGAGGSHGQASLGVCLPVDIRNAIRQSDNDVTGKGWGDVGDPMYTLTAGGKTPGVCCIQGDIAAGRREAQHGMGVCEDVSFSLLTSSPHCVAYNYVVRRLTPRECERLQGFPDDWTLIPWRGKPAADCPDSHRYKAVGNSMAVPVMWYIGRRIQIVERRQCYESHS